MPLFPLNNKLDHPTSFLYVLPFLPHCKTEIEIREKVRKRERGEKERQIEKVRVRVSEKVREKRRKK
jgi:hypothetical protein